MKIGIMGSNGFIGSALFAHLSKLPIVTVVGLTRDNYQDYVGESFDVFINAAGQNSNFWGHHNPHIDFTKSVVPVYNSLFDFKIGKYIFISSIATYDAESNYGYNKTLSEDIIKRYAESYIILRCSSIIDKSHPVGIVPDIVHHRPLFVTADSIVQFISRNKLVQIVEQCITLNINNESFNVGGNPAIKISDIGKFIGTPISYKQDATYREYNMDVSETHNVFSLKTSLEYIGELL